jgi:ATP-binding cassette subfamily B protein
LLRKPQILILDEATANIDIETEQTIMNGIRREFPDMLVIMVSHRNSLRQYADQVLDFDSLRFSSESDMCASGDK